MNLLIPFFLLLSFCLSASASEKPNVLFIAIDDMNDWVSCLGGHPNGHTPNIDRLAQRGTLFTNAHCQAPICNPSRTSVMYGLRPSSTGIYMNAPTPWRTDVMDQYVSLPRHFAANGYQTYAQGKLYHGSGLPKGDFDVTGPKTGQKNPLDERLVPATPGGAAGLWDFGGQRYKEEKFQDYISATWAIDVLNTHSQTDDRPFFLATGFYRPHVPFYAPKRIVDSIDIEAIELPPHRKDDRDDIPEIAWEVTVAGAPPSQEWFVNERQWKPAVQAYLACIQWTDEQVGRLLDSLDNSPHADNTIIVLYSDHGFFLGEKQRWAKQALWERATRVPFIVSVPGMEQGESCSRPAELLSIYPTLIDLCDLSDNEQLEGVSLRPLLEDVDAEWSHLAITTHGKDNHAVRNDNWRYIRYHNGSEELYNLKNDPNEWTNLASRKKHAALKEQLASHFPKTNVEPAGASNPKAKQKGKKGNSPAK